ncbi:MAG: DNA phosphorothioation-dependent restriction protein DptH [Bacillus sp. (in: firmicutes)]
MSNLFYKYIGDRLTNYFNQTGIRSGDKFYFVSETEEQTKNLYDNLAENPNSIPFTYRHESGSEFRSFLISFGDKKLLIAATINGITPDFLVTIRNLVGTKQDPWKDIALLSLFHENLDSLAGGGSSLQKEGMPLHVDTIREGLTKEIETSSVPQNDKVILKYYLKQNNDDYLQKNNSVFDFEEVLGLIKKELLNRNDYTRLGFFYDSTLGQESPKVMEKRLEENSELFKRVEHIHAYGNPEQELEKWFDDRGLNKLKQEDWKEIDYKDVKASFENNKATKPLQYQEQNKKLTEDGLIFWERSDKETVSGRRKRHIIIFNPEKVTNINVSFKFDEFLKKENMKGDTANFTVVSGKQLKASIPHTPGSTTFKKITYKHNEETKSSFEFRIAVLECKESLLEAFKTTYAINVLKKDSSIELQTEDGVLLFNKPCPIGNELIVEQQKEVFSFEENETRVVIGSEIEESNVYFSVQTNDTNIPFKVKFESRIITPVNGRFVWKVKREKQQHFTLLDNDKIILGTSEYTTKEHFRRNIELEKQIIQNQIFHGSIYYEKIQSQPIELPSEVVLHYGKLLQYFLKNQTLPSLAYMDEELQFLRRNYVNSVIEEIKGIEENEHLTVKLKNLSKLGLLVEGGKLYLTPLHPLNIAYQLKVNSDINEEELDTHILNRLTANNLLPYFIHENQLYKVQEQQHSFEWIYFGLHQAVSNEETKSFTKKLVKSKMKEFMNHFSYLFLHSRLAPLKINLINIDSDKEFLQGVFEFIKDFIEKAKDESEIIPLEISIYQKNDYPSSFELLSKYDSVDKIGEQFNLSFESTKIDQQDILRIFRDKVSFSKQKFGNDEYKYAHLSFFKMDYNNEISKSLMTDISTGVSLSGLLSGLPSVNMGNDYRSGFGSKYTRENIDNDNLLTFVLLYNEFICNMNNSGSEPYHKGVSIVTRMSELTNDSLRSLYKASNWVTFIDPKVGLEFFKSNDDNLVIIHYSDQYTSTSSYDSITVTNKTEQYKRVIKEFLHDHQIQSDEIDYVISWFNVVNGEWLLKLIGNASQFPREKLSIISAIKYGISYLHHPNILWIPISMEEILRISNATGLNRDGGIFTANNLNVHGQHSDDILLMGVEFANSPKVHFFPVEVKIGLNQQGTINKAQTQIQKTKAILQEQTKRFSEEGKELFKNKFYRNFFIQLLITNAEKLLLYGLISQQEMEKLNEVRHLLLNDQYEISNELVEICGDSGIISFTRDTHFRTLKLESGILKMDLTEQDALRGIVENVEVFTEQFVKEQTDLTSDYMPYHHYQITKGNAEQYKVEKQQKEEVDLPAEDTPLEEVKPLDGGNYEHVNVGFIIDEHEKPGEDTNLVDLSHADGRIEILCGTNLANHQEVYWKPTDTTLISHPNTGIIGTMGTGKTQFTKSLVAQLIKNTHRNVNGTKVGILIFDYKGDYISEDFLSKVNGKKYDLYQLPYNPLSLFVGKNSMNLLPLHTARGITTTLEKSFGLGEVQTSILLDTIMEAYQKKGIIKNIRESWTNEAPTFNDVYRIFTSRDDVKVDKLYKALKDLYDFEIFEADSEKTVPLFDLIDGVTVINLQGYDESIQNLVVAITLDQFYTQMQLTGDSAYEGNYREIRKFVLVDEADNFMSKDFDSLRKILKEGRSFGVGTILSTQFLSHFSTGSNEYADYILSWIVHNVTDIKAKDVKYIFNTITNDETENILQRIKQLEKHQSIIKLGSQKQPILIRDKAFWELGLEPVK